MLEAVYSGISRPDIGALFDQLSSASTYEEFACQVKGAEGSAGLMRFMQLDLHDAVTLATDGAVARRLVRVIAGNPAAIAKMTRYLGDGGSYAPDRGPLRPLVRGYAMISDAKATVTATQQLTGSCHTA